MGESTPPPTVDEKALYERVGALVERGLERYGAGDLRGAMSEWEHALALKPDDARAKEYADYVRENFDVLAQRFEAARQVARVSAEFDVPFGLETFDDGEAYEEVEVGRDEPASPVSVADPVKVFQGEASIVLSHHMEAVDEGWALDDFAAALPPPPAAAELDEDLAGVLDAVSEGLLAVGGDAPPPAEIDLDLEGSLELVHEQTIDAELPDGGDYEGETLDLGRDTSLGGLANVGQMDQDPPTIELGLAGAGTGDGLASADDDEITVPGGVEDDVAFGSGIPLSEDALAALQRATPDGVPSEETTSERPGIRRGFALPNLDELDIGTRKDDRSVDVDGNGDQPVRVSFRGQADDAEDDELTMERHASQGLDDELTIERRSADGLIDPTTQQGLEDEMTIERQSADGLLASPAVIVDESAFGNAAAAGEIDGGTREFPEDLTVERNRTPEITGDSYDAISAELKAHLDDGASLDESEADRVRRRVSSLIETGQREGAGGRYSAAVVAIDLALDEEPDSAVAQKLIHRHRDLLFELFHGFLGDMNGVPTLALPMHELSTEQLDNRSVFLLSRIDGTFSFEEILDVSGMTQMESLRHLCRMMMRGILEVR